MRMRKNIKLLAISFAAIIMCAVSLSILCSRKTHSSNENKDIVEIPLIAKLYSFPENFLHTVQATESARKFQRRNERDAKEQKRETQPETEIVSAYFVVPQKIATFYPLVITIFYNRCPSQEESESTAPLEVHLERMAKNHSQRRFVNDPSVRYLINFFRPFDDKSGFKSIMHAMRNIGAPLMLENGQYAEDNYASGTEGLAFDYYNLKKNYCVRVVQSIYLRNEKEYGTNLIEIPEAPKYFKDWYGGNYLPSNPADKYQRPSLRDILPAIAKSVMENIEETGLIEKFLAEKAAAKSPKPANPKPKP